MIASTIRHDSPCHSIVAYLSAIDEVRQAARIADYMTLMHVVERSTISVLLAYLTRAGKVERVGRGLYRRRWDKRL